MKNEEYWSLKDFCQFLKVGRTTIYNGVKAGRFPQPIKIGGLSRWKRSEVEACIDGFAAHGSTK